MLPDQPENLLGVSTGYRREAPHPRSLIQTLGDEQ
jgi:hypothetical protein